MTNFERNAQACISMAEMFEARAAKSTDPATVSHLMDEAEWYRQHATMHTEMPKLFEEPTLADRVAELEDQIEELNRKIDRLAFEASVRMK